MGTCPLQASLYFCCTSPSKKQKISLAISAEATRDLRSRLELKLRAMVIRIASVVLSFAGLLALILGLLIWTASASNLIQMHMLLGLLAVGALWVIGIGQAFSQGGSWPIAISALIAGAIMIILGWNQSALMVGSLHWVIQIVHLVLGLLVIGLGHMGAARYRKVTIGQR